MIGSLTSTKERKQNRSSKNIYDDGFLRVEYENYYLSCKNQMIKLTRGDFLVTSFLVKNIENYVPADTIWEFLWGKSKPLNFESLKVHLSRIRQKLSPFGIRIENKPNCGYKLTARVS